MKKKPNILVLYCDQHSARALGCYGNKEVKTPNLDKLASEGIVMDNAFCNNPICTPSRMCMLSGQYVHNFGYYGLMGRKPENLPTMFTYFHELGYRNGVVGKIHTPAGWVSQDCDFVRDGYGYEIPVTPKNMDQQEGVQGLSDDDYHRYLKEKGLDNQRDDKIIHEWYQKHGHTQGQCVDARPSRLPTEHCFENWCATECIDFIEDAVKDDQPFFMWLTLPRPHQTYCPAKEYWDLYEGMEFQLPPNADDDMSQRDEASREKQDTFQKSSAWNVFDPKDFDSARRRVLRGYYACVSQSDAAIGRVLDAVEKLGITDDTIIVYSTDHGEFAGEHGMIEKAPGIGYSCVTKVPMIWKYAGAPAGVRRSEIMESVDIFPTICQIAGLEQPDWVDGCAGECVLRDDTPIKDIAVTENPNTKTIHTKKYKLTQFLPEFHGGKEFGELYDRENDPWEMHNLYFEPEYQQVVNDLRYQLYCWLVRNTRAVTANPTIPKADKSFDLSSGVSWDLAQYVGAWDKDHKVGRDFYQDMIDRGHRLYL